AGRACRHAEPAAQAAGLALATGRRRGLPVRDGSAGGAGSPAAAPAHGWRLPAVLPVGRCDVEGAHRLGHRAEPDPLLRVVRAALPGGGGRRGRYIAAPLSGRSQESGEEGTLTPNPSPRGRESKSPPSPAHRE